MSEKTLEKKFSWRELDILRGLAAFFMIINHGGYEILIPDLATHGISGFIIFISSSALVSSNWRLESLQYKRFNKAGEFGVSPPKLILFQ
jgi:uncharacterized membrane protein